ncbi:pimeloyl-ACP methyl ester carboxylesterase [Sphingomonas sp. F9_3S_D5_B_2]
MTPQILFIQGGGDDVHDQWDNKLVDSLAAGLDIDPGAIIYPRMPDEGDPHYAPWKVAMVNEINALDEGAILIGHSLGGAIMINAIAENPPTAKPSAIILASAPFIGQGGWPSDEIEAKPNLGEQLPQGVPVFLFQGSADETAPPAHAELYAKAIAQARVHRLEGRDHQLNNDLSEVAALIRRISGA